MRFFFEIAYNGSAYHGWQKQKNAISLQEVISQKIQQFFNDPKLEIVGCGRTDAGVNARQFFFHIDLNKHELSTAIFHLNNMLPRDIAILSIHQVDDQCHARFDATSRTYRYYIHTQKNPFLNACSLQVKKDLDLMAMNKACSYFLGEHDFTSFSKLHTDVKTNLCTVTSIGWSRVSDQLVFEISANRFLRNMVRAIVGTMLEVGSQKILPEKLATIIKAKDRNVAGFSVAANGLFLEEVVYPFIQIDASLK